LLGAVFGGGGGFVGEVDGSGGVAEVEEVALAELELAVVGGVEANELVAAHEGGAVGGVEVADASAVVEEDDFEVSAGDVLFVDDEVAGVVATEGESSAGLEAFEGEAAAGAASGELAQLPHSPSLW
jgi:hypothetical protein